jgi:acetoin:2,6-dichlorophenolindophenol oxidoreductase subunit beta
VAERELSFGLAINEALTQAMEADPGLIVIGQGVKSPWYVGNTCRGLVERFGEGRVIDSPVSENAVTGTAVGAALAGCRAVVVHPRMDFMLFAFDPIVNEAANWHAMSGGKANVPVVFWGIVNRGGEQAAQHSQALHSMLAHVPGLKVVAPSTPRDAKGLMLAAIRDDGPVVFIDDRWLYEVAGPVPEEPIPEPIGVSAVRRQGDDVTIVGFSSMMPKVLEAAAQLEAASVSAEVIDLRTLKPLDMAPVCGSLRKTGRGVICDTGWKTGGIGAEICAQATEGAWGALRAPLARVALPDTPAPAARTLEAAYYPSAGDVVRAVEAVLRGAAR